MDDREFQLQQARRIGRLQGALDTISATAESGARHLSTFERLQERLQEIVSLCNGAMAIDQRIETGNVPQCPYCQVYIVDEANRDRHRECTECEVPLCKLSPNCPRRLFDRHPKS